MNTPEIQGAKHGFSKTTVFITTWEDAQYRNGGKQTLWPNKLWLWWWWWWWSSWWRLMLFRKQEKGGKQKDFFSKIYASLGCGALSAKWTAGPNVLAYFLFAWPWHWTLQKPPLLKPPFSWFLSTLELCWWAQTGSGHHSLFSVRVLFPQVFLAFIHGLFLQWDAEFTESLWCSPFSQFRANGPLITPIPHSHIHSNHANSGQLGAPRLAVVWRAGTATLDDWFREGRTWAIVFQALGKKPGICRPELHRRELIHKPLLM